MLRLREKASNVYDVAMNGFLGAKENHPNYVLNVGLLIGISQESDLGERKANHP